MPSRLWTIVSLVIEVLELLLRHLDSNVTEDERNLIRAKLESRMAILKES